MVKQWLIWVIGTISLTSCFREKPLQYDGSYAIKLTVVFRDDSLGYNEVLPDLPVRLRITNYSIGDFNARTDSAGVVVFDDLPFATYDLDIKATVRLPFMDSTGALVPDSFINIIVVDTMREIQALNSNFFEDTVYTMAANALPGLKINEIYYTGPQNTSFWFYDQFVELYNSSDEIKYLDGMIVCRIYHMLDRVTYAFQFPGTPLTGRQYPVQPGEFVVLAVDAYDHRKIFATSIDLSGADWEFVNQMDFGDYDDPHIPNLFNIITGKNVDFLINLSSNVIALADGSDAIMSDGLAINTVVDCVEYCSLSEHIKDIDRILDRGWAGRGNQKYSGQSVERITPGFDTNNSFVDFVIIKPPTPGWSH